MYCASLSELIIIFMMTSGYLAMAQYFCNIYLHKKLISCEYIVVLLTTL